MSAAINDGGPAFPDVQFTHNNGDTSFKNNGMTLRDYFAGQALAGMLADPDTTESPDVLARACYRCADAMIDARKASQ